MMMEDLAVILLCRTCGVGRLVRGRRLPQVLRTRASAEAKLLPGAAERHTVP